MVVSTPKGCVENLSGWSLRGPSTVARGSFALCSWAGTAGVGCADWAKWMILSQATGSESRSIRMLERGAPVKLRKYLAGPQLPSLRPRNDTSGVALCPQLATVAPPSRTWNVWWREATVCGFPVLPAHANRKEGCWLSHAAQGYDRCIRQPRCCGVLEPTTPFRGAGDRRHRDNERRDHEHHLDCAADGAALTAPVSWTRDRVSPGDPRAGCSSRHHGVDAPRSAGRAEQARGRSRPPLVGCPVGYAHRLASPLGRGLRRSGVGGAAGFPRGT